MEDGLCKNYDLAEIEDENATVENDVKRCRITRRRKSQSTNFCVKTERNASLKKVSSILQKKETERTVEETQVLKECSEAVEEVQLRWRKRDEAKRRLEEFEDPPEVLEQKCEILARAIAQSQHLVVYTGAGISTAARIPDYRGSDGIWTRLQQGKDIGNHDLSLAEPTYTHMALTELYRLKVLKYVVSQNCDGLHLRSGLPRTAMSELHGNMYIEVCKTCKPHKEYWRLFDVTENTARYSHKTMRKCYVCNGPLLDTIVHFGERGSLHWPLNWAGACKNANLATTILCLGSSLKVLKRYPWLWQMDKPAKKRPNLYIVNLQWTPKDECANVKIHGKCDRVMEMVMKLLDIQVPAYDRLRDPIYFHASDLCELELHTTSQPFLKKMEESKDCVKREEISNVSTSQLSICDIASNSRIDHQNTSNSLPEVKKPCSFSIDSILQNTPVQPNPFTFQNYPSLLAYCNLSYSSVLYYPYQTSFMYPGLHNIISAKEASSPIKQEEPEPVCWFCHKHYSSDICLFYPKTDAVFSKKEFRYSKIERVEKPNICICCDYTTDEEETPSDGSEINGLQESEPKKVQAGWFGKGYRKNRRVKKRP